jgi:O-acetyl-ADP-ribose deacetylase (regulator of RNase III)
MSKFEIIKGSSVDQNVDAIVNAANGYLMAGGGVCGEIFRRAGYEDLTNYCSNIKTPLNDGEAVITPAFNIENAKFIIHAVGPDFEVTPNADNELFNAYYNSLLLLKENNLHSIAFPLISSGLYGGNKENSIKESYNKCREAYIKFINENINYDVIVKICAYTEKEYKEIEN